MCKASAANTWQDWPQRLTMSTRPLITPSSGLLRIACRGMSYDSACMHQAVIGEPQGVPKIPMIGGLTILFWDPCSSDEAMSARVRAAVILAVSLPGTSDAM